MISRRYRLLDEFSGRRRSFSPVQWTKKKESFFPSFHSSSSFFCFLLSSFVKTNGIGARLAVPQLNKGRIKRLKRNINIIIRREGR